ncbi:MAG TPA: ATP-dependent Clp protease ATP-binding subunit, partial [Candidatus Saccharimonadales bacterium]|nr:ATP-dependent Clp protease ATP-binding subunit [Candidatus Saccharimonadales bacterium]
MIEYVRIYTFYRRALIRSIRLVVFSILLLIIVNQVIHGSTPKLPLFLFNLFVIFEVFFHHKISKISPLLPVSKNDGKDPYQSFSMQALLPFVTQQKTSAIIRKLIKYPQVKLFLQKANISNREMPYVDLDPELLVKSAFDAAVTFKGKFVTTGDILVAYFFLIEKDKKILFAHQLKSEDLYNISYWIRLQMPLEENPKKLRVRFEGSGIGESFVSGWTPETKKYTSVFTASALKYMPMIRGREEEFKTMLEGLIKVENNNVLLVGDIGGGKENLVRALAYYSFEGELGGYLDYKRVLELLVGALTAGTTNRSDLESRLQEIISEISHAQDVLLYVPDFQNILGASSYGLDLSGALLPFLKTGNLPLIATMTTGAYKTYMEKNPLKEAFTVITLKEPDKNTAMQMILGDAMTIEKKYKVILSYRSIASSVELADRFVQDQALPGSAIALLETVANKIALSKDAPYFEGTRQKMVLEEHLVKEVEKDAHVAIGMPTGEEINLLLHLEERLHARVIEQNEAITAISEAMRRVRSGMMTSEKPVSFLFLGPTGVGKTETAKALADFYFGGEKNMIRLDMSEYTGEDGIERLLGAPPGKGDERGELTDKVHDNPASLILLDEFEKANPQIHNLFLQVLDDGRLTDNKGVTVSFRNAIIIATSNAGSEYIREQVGKGVKVDKAFQRGLLEYLQTKNIFKPEFLNRFDDVVTFKPLADAQVAQVVNLLLQSLTKTLEEQDIKLIFEPAVIEKISKEGFDSEFGARPLRRYIQDNIEDMIAQKKLTKELDRGKTATFSI